MDQELNAPKEELVTTAQETEHDLIAQTTGPDQTAAPAAEPEAAREMDERVPIEGAADWFVTAALARVRLQVTLKALIGDTPNFKTLKGRAGDDSALYIQGRDGIFYLVSLEDLKRFSRADFDLYGRAIDDKIRADYRFDPMRAHVIVFLNERQPIQIGESTEQVRALWVRKANATASFINLEWEVSQISRAVEKG